MNQTNFSFAPDPVCPPLEENTSSKKQVILIFVALSGLLLFSAGLISLNIWKTIRSQLGEESARRAVQPAPNFSYNKPNFNSISNQTHLLWAQGKYQESLTLAQELLTYAQTNKEEAITNYWMGLSHYKLENLGEAEEYLQKATELVHLRKTS